MYVWGRPPGLSEGERIVWKAQANRYVGRHVSAGRLYLTDRRVIFRAIRLDHMIWGGDLEADRGHLERCEVAEPPPATLLRPALRLRLKLVFTDQPDELFVVWSARRSQALLATILDTLNNG